MNTEWQVGETTLQLYRFPPNQHDKALQAWDSADELAVNTLLADPPGSPILIFDDQFGALTLGLKDFSPICVSDSYIGEQALIHNWRANELSETMPKCLPSIGSLPAAKTIVIRLTKNLSYLEHHLKSIISSPSFSNDEQVFKVIATGKTTLVTSAAIKLFEKYFSNVSTSLAKKKSRLIFAESPIVQKTTSDPVYSSTWPERDLTLNAYANVFSKDQIDIGGRFLVDHMPNLTAEPSNKDSSYTVMDVGCGNGLLGVAYLKENEEKISSRFTPEQFKMVFADESIMAIESSRLNVNANTPLLTNHCEFRLDDCLTQQPSASVDLILCNPPFHQQNAVTTHIAEQMIAQAAKALKNKGELYLVANRNLPYQHLLTRAFGEFYVVAKSEKFIIYSCTKEIK